MGIFLSQTILIHTYSESRRVRANDWIIFLVDEQYHLQSTNWTDLNTGVVWAGCKTKCKLPIVSLFWQMVDMMYPQNASLVYSLTDIWQPAIGCFSQGEHAVKNVIAVVFAYYGRLYAATALYRIFNFTVCTYPLQCYNSFMCWIMPWILDDLRDSHCEPPSVDLFGFHRSAWSRRL